MMLHRCAAALIEFIYPEDCLHCGARRGEKSWSARGALVPGLRWCDGSHLCRACGGLLAPRVERGTLPMTEVPVFAGCRTTAPLVNFLGQFKYHGVRGVAWPLAGLLEAAIAEACGVVGAVDYLVAVPLHPRRRRQRGFNQAEILAHLASRMGTETTTPLLADVVCRTRSTGQQAKLASDQERAANVADAFVARPGHGRDWVGIIDDLVTGGATGDAVAQALMAAGWRVRWMASLGVALRCTDGGDSFVDTGGTPP